jgi:diguanylate cyclase (GGDEF)-like protein
VGNKRSGASSAPPGNGEGRDAGRRRFETLADEQRRLGEDQTASDADQTASDTDQDLSDLDRELSERDQLASQRDQAASDRDQEVADREHAFQLEPDSRDAYEAGRAGRAAGTQERDVSTQARGATAEERARHAEKRDESARQRDLTAEGRDAAANRRDLESAKLEEKVARRSTPLRVAIGLARSARTRAAEDRSRAAQDRIHAAQDRERAAKERAEVLAELRNAHLDELTGALRRGAGELALQTEVERAQRGDGQLVLAFVDVDSLREVNNRDGHAAGDALLRDVVSAIRSSIRSYEPIVRYGGDEFVCAMSGIDRGQAESRFRGISDSLASREQGGAITVGLAELEPEDGLPELVERADRALLAARGEQPRGGD